MERSENTVLDILSKLTALCCLNRSGDFIKTESFEFNTKCKPSWIERYYFLLNLFEIQKGQTVDSLMPAYALYDHDNNEEKVQKRLRNTLNSLEKPNIAIGENNYGPLISRSQMTSYMGHQNVYSLTADGHAALKFINKKVSLPEGLKPIENDAYDRLYDTVKKKSLGNHALFVSTIVSNLLPLFMSGRVCDFEIEAGRSDAYKAEKYVRQKEIITPDVSFMYHTADMISAPAFFEADLYTEGGNALTEKASRELYFGTKMTKQYGQYPCTTCFVTNEKNYYNPVKLDKESETLRQKEAERNYFKNPHVKALLDAMVEVYADLHSETQRISNGEFSAVDAIEYAERSMHESYVDAFTDLESTFKYLGRLKAVIREWEKEATAKEGYPVLLDAENFCSFFDVTEKTNYSREARINRSISATLTRRNLLARGLASDSSVIRCFENGQSMFFLNQNELPSVLPSMFPSLNGMNSVKKVLRCVGLPDHIRRFWPSRPLIENDYGYYVNLRSSFLVGDTCVGFEDISYDITSLARIRDYIGMPVGLAKNKLLVIIINDDLTVSSGDSLYDTAYWTDRDPEVVDDNGTVKDHFLSTYGSSCTLPFKYDRMCDFCFVRRSEFLDPDADIHPFVLFGKKQFYDRTSEGIREDTRCISFGMGEPYHSSTLAVDDSFHGYLKEQH